jgi:WD40 repeat protein
LKDGSVWDVASHRLRVCDAATGAELAVLRGNAFGAVSFSPDGRYLAGTLRRLQVLDAATLTLGVVLRHRPEVTFAAYSPDGRRIVSASSDGTIVQWTAPLDGQALLDHARELLPRELSLAERESALL